MLSQPELQTVIEDALAYATQRGADAVDAIISDESGFSVSARRGELEEVEYHKEQGFSVTLYQSQRSASVSTTELTPKAIRTVIDKAISLVRYTNEDPAAGLADKSELAFNYPDLDLSHVWDIDTQQAAELAIACDVAARDYDARITDSEGSNVSTYQGLRVYGNSLGFIGGYPTSRHSISCQVVAKDKDDMQTDYDYSTARHPADLQDPLDIARAASAKVIQRLNPRQIKTQSCPVIFHSSVAKTLLGSFIGAISGGSLYRKSTFLLDAIGQQLFPDFISIMQQPHLKNAMGSRPFDYDGVMTKAQPYVTNGVLERYVLSSYSARRLGLKTTGNAGGVFNLTVTHSDQALSDLLQAMGTGLLVTDLIGDGVRLMTGDYSRGASGYWIENGEIQYPVSEITIAGNLKEMYAGIVAIGNDVDTRGSIHTGSIWLNKMMIAGTS